MQKIAFCLKNVLGFVLFMMPFFAWAQRIFSNPTISLPSWFQAIGTVIGILIAIMIVGMFFFLQRKWEKERALKRKEERQEHIVIETRSLLLATRHELLSYYMWFQEDMQEAKSQLDANGYIDTLRPVAYEKYYIYPILITKPNAVMDAKLMTHLLSAYSLQIQWVDVLKWNNYLVEALKKGDVTLTTLKEHALKIKVTYEAMTQECKIVFDCINEDGTLNSDNKHQLNLRYYFRNSAQYVQFK